MAEILYRAEIRHTEKTVEQLYKMQYYVYEKPRMILRALIGFGLVVAAAVSALPTPGARRCRFFWGLAAGEPGFSRRRAG